MTTNVSHSFICLLAMPRTGSSYLADLLDLHPDCEVHTELFHRGACFLGVPHRDRLVPQIAHHLGRKLEDYRDPAIVAWAHQDPAGLLNFLAQRQVAPHLFFKLFPRHLDLPDLHQAILQHAQITPLLLTRHPLTTFVSQLKALQTQNWSHRDTTDLQVQTDANHFLDYVEKRQAWYGLLRETLQRQKRSVIQIQYETLTACGSEQAALDLLIDAITQAGCALPHITLPLEKQHLRPKQDRSGNPLSAIQEVATFIRDIEARQASQLLQPFLQAPY